MSRAFDPWKGEQYANGGFEGIRLLILGESQYWPPPHSPGWRGEPTAECRDSIRKEVISQALNARAHFYTKITKLVLGLPAGTWLPDETRIAFWHQVAFFNYVQWWLPGPRVRPSEEMWAAAREALPGVLEELQPKVLLVLGSQLRSRLPMLSDAVNIAEVNHPSSVGFSYAKWAPAVRHAIDSAKRQRQY